MKIKARQTGFTLVEMLVAVGIAAALVVAIATIFSLAVTSINQSLANTEVNNRLRVAFSWLEKDFRRLRLDGPLMLSSQLYRCEDSDEQIRTDRLMFLLSGNIPSLVIPHYRASLALVTYGQDISIYGDGGLPKKFTTSLTRHLTLIVAELPTDPPFDLSQLTGDPSHIQAMSFAGFLAGWYSNPFPSNPDWGRPNITNGKMLHTRLLDNILSMRIVRYRKPDKPKKYWLPGDEVPESRIFDMSPGVNKIIGPRYTKPLWIDIEITIQDTARQMRDGYSSVYRVNLPVTNRQMADWEAIEENAGGGW